MSAESRARVKHILQRVAGIGLACLLGATAMVYAVDYAVFRYRVTANRKPFGQVTISHYYAVPQKSGKTQFIFDPPTAESCVNAVFPRAGLVPCWYLQRHREERTDM